MSEICVTPLHIRGYEHESSCLVFYVSFEGSDLFLMFKHRDFIESHLSSLICVCVVCTWGCGPWVCAHTQEARVKCLSSPLITALCLRGTVSHWSGSSQVWLGWLDGHWALRVPHPHPHPVLRLQVLVGVPGFKSKSTSSWEDTSDLHTGQEIRATAKLLLQELQTGFQAVLVEAYNLSSPGIWGRRIPSLRSALANAGVQSQPG